MMYFLQDDVNVQFIYTGIRLPEDASSDINSIASQKTETAMKSILQTLVLSFGEFFYLTLIFYPNVQNCILLHLHEIVEGLYFHYSLYVCVSNVCL